jgi:ketosteroid isomerase-like protein
MSKDVEMQAEPRLIGPAEDVQAVRDCHREWWAANHGLDIARMEKEFAPQYLMWNLNGHPYYGLDEKVKLWEHYGRTLEVPDPPPVWDLRITVDGDMAYLTCEGELPVRARTDEGWGASNIETQGSDIAPAETLAFRFRETSTYRRDDGRGNKVWKMWHFHCSPLAPEDEPRPGFDDTWRSRGGDNGGRHELT